MRRITHRLRGAVVFFGSVFLSLSGSFGEVSVGLDSSQTVSGLVLMMRGAGGEGSDPWPWGRVRTHVDASWQLNPDGDVGSFPDGEPSLGWDPVGDTPEVTWARHDGNDYEIVISRWEGGQWSVPISLTDNAVDDLDPEIAHAPDGTARLTFWRGSAVYTSTRAVGGDWSPIDLVDAGGRSSVAGTATERVAYQRDRGDDPTEIVAAERDGSWIPVILATTTFDGFRADGDLDVRLEAQQGAIWIVWEDSASQLGWSELLEDGTWSAPRYEPVADPSEEDAARFRIKTRAID